MKDYILIYNGEEVRYFTRFDMMGKAMFGGALYWDSAKRMTREEANETMQRVIERCPNLAPKLEVRHHQFVERI